MLKAAFYQVEQCQEPPEEIRAEMQEFAADVGLGFHAFYMDSPKPWYLSEPSSVLRKMVEDASERKFDILIIERMSDFTNCYGRTEGASGDEKARCPDFLLERTYA